MDLNQTKAFEAWFSKEYQYARPEVKAFMFKAWCARGSFERKNNKIKN